MTWNSGIQTNQILKNDDEVCIPRLSSILLAALKRLLSWYIYILWNDLICNCIFMIRWVSEIFEMHHLFGSWPALCSKQCNGENTLWNRISIFVRFPIYSGNSVFGKFFTEHYGPQNVVQNQYSLTNLEFYCSLSEFFLLVGILK